MVFEKPRLPQLYVLAVGIDNYFNPEIKALEFCRADARATAQVLTSDPARKLFAQVHQTILLDEQATREGIAEAFKKISRQARPQDTFIFYFSGRSGLREQKEQAAEFILAPWDVDLKVLQEDAENSKNAREVEQAALPVRLLKTYFDQIPADRQFIFFDTDKSSEAFHELARLFADWDQFDESNPEGGVVIIGVQGQSYEDRSIGHGMLTHSLLQGITGAADLLQDERGRITAHELNAYLPFKVSQQSKGRMTIQSYVRGANFDIAPAPNAAPDPSLRGSLADEKDDEPQAEPPAATAPQPAQDYALLFATNEYEHYSRLANPIPDARAIRDDLEKIYGFQCELVENPTKKVVMETLKKYSERQYNAGDRLLVFFAGHGDYDEFLQEGFLIVRDSLKDEEHTRSIRHSELSRILLGIRCHQTLVVLDACFSGTFDQRLGQAAARTADLYGNISREEFVQRKMKYEAFKYFASGGKEYVSDGRPGQHSPFARKMLEALRSYGGQDGVLTIAEIAGFLEKLNPTPRAGELPQRDQPGSDFVFVSKK